MGAGQGRTPSENWADIEESEMRELLTDVLRERIGFDGLVVSDYGGVNELQDLHRVTDSPEASARRAVLAGMDCELPSGTCYETHLERLAKADPAVAEAVTL
jgi:beta-glucosidase